jgi:hypothetical protein
VTLPPPLSLWTSGDAILHRLPFPIPILSYTHGTLIEEVDTRDLPGVCQSMFQVILARDCSTYYLFLCVSEEPEVRR